MNDVSPFTIVGSGLAGSLMACYLAKAGHRVTLFEKRNDPRLSEATEGRSINLALSVRGIHALEQVGLAQKILDDAIAMPGRMIHSRSGQQSFQPYGRDPSKAIYSVSRNGLNCALLDAASSYSECEILFEHQCAGIDLSERRVFFQDGELSIPYRRLIAADGAFSAIRAQLQRERFDYQQHYLTHGYKELCIPPTSSGSHRLEPNALHIWPRKSFMLIALPNRDGSFTCTLFAPFEGENSFEAMRDVQHFFREELPDALELMPTLEDDFRQNPIGPLVTIRCHPWQYKGEVVLLGDACHAVVPFLGQGMNAAFEDCFVLSECLARHGDNTETAFVEYQDQRKEHVDVLADLAIENYYEMRDHVGSSLFRWKKKGEVILHRLLGNLYIPLYTLISFTRVPYADALRRAKRQSRILTVSVVGMILLLILIWILSWI